MQYSALMDDDTAALAHAIGVRIRQERQSRRWTLDHLAESAGASRRTVINVEQGTANPSVGILLKISDALGIGLSALVASPEPKQLAVTRAGQAPALWTGEFGGRGCLMAGTEPPDVMELWDWTMNPGDQHSSSAHVAGTRELIHVLAGTISIEVGEQSVELQVGDSLSFPGDVSHSYANRQDSPARFTLAVYEPGVGTGLRGDSHHA